MFKAKISTWVWKVLPSAATVQPTLTAKPWGHIIDVRWGSQIVATLIMQPHKDFCGDSSLLPLLELDLSLLYQIQTNNTTLYQHQPHYQRIQKLISTKLRSGLYSLQSWSNKCFYPRQQQEPSTHATAQQQASRMEMGEEGSCCSLLGVQQTPLF